MRTRRFAQRATCVALLALAVPTLALAVTDDRAAALTAQSVWILASAALVFLMQSGFLALETGLVRAPGAPVTAMKSVIDWAIVVVIWLLFGFGLAFGASVGGWLGTGYLLGEGVEASRGGWVYFVFQLGFAGAAVTIVSGALAERIGFHTYVLCSVVNAALLYPLVAHWIWGASQHDQATLLAQYGFIDFAGATVVHSLGGWISLAAIWVLGPRIGRFDADGRPLPMPPYSMPLAALGALLLWIGWWGFNGGSAGPGESVGEVLVNSNVAGGVACFVAWVHGRWQQPERDVEAKVLGGALAGLVAITACANLVSPASAILIGAIAGVVHNLVFELLLKLRLDDAVGAIPVHLGGGVLGTLCVALFGKAELLPHGRLEQLGVQVLGVVVVGVFALAVTIALMAVLKRTVGLRLAPREELRGATLCRLPAEAPSAEVLDEAELRRRMGGG